MSGPRAECLKSEEGNGFEISDAVIWTETVRSHVGQVAFFFRFVVDVSSCRCVVCAAFKRLVTLTEFDSIPTDILTTVLKFKCCSLIHWYSRNMTDGRCMIVNGILYEPLGSCCLGFRTSQIDRDSWGWAQKWPLYPVLMIARRERENL